MVAKITKQRTCNRCHEKKVITLFQRYRKRDGTMGYKLHCKTCHAANSRLWRQNSPEGRKRARDARRKTKYNLTAEQYAALLAAQGGVCAICLRPMRYELHVEHCHANNVVRGLACKTCNRRILGSARDDAALLRRAADYLDNPPAFAVIGRVTVNADRIPKRTAANDRFFNR